MLNNLFFPDTVALIGASRTAGKVGHDILFALIEGGFTGKIVAVNPAGGEILGTTIHESLDDYSGTVDLAIIALNKPQVIPATRQVLAKGAKSVIIVTAGFKEVGNDGAQLEQELAELCRRSGARLLGPNCLGIINTTHRLNCSFAGPMPLAGSLGIFSQSGALCASLLNVASRRELGISKLVSVGNKGDINEEDILDYLGADEQTRVIVGYLENIVSGTGFVQSATRASANKPIIVLKSGTSQAGRKAAATHTGVMTGTDTAYAAAFKRSGIVRAENFEALFDYAAAFTMQPLPQGNRVLIITNAGGPGIMAADAVERCGMKVAELASNTAASLRERLPAAAGFLNPIDVLGDALPERYETAFRTAQIDESVDGIVIILSPQSMTDPAETIRVLAKAVQQAGSKPVLVCLMGDSEGCKDELARAGLPHFPSPERAVEALKAMWEYSSWRARPARMVTRFRVNRRRVEHIITRSRSNGIYRLNEAKTKNLLEAYGFSIPPGAMVTDRAEVEEKARRLGFPITMKIVSSDIVHKEDIGGIRKGLTTIQQLQDSYDLMMLRASQMAPGAKINGIYLENLGEPGLEVILGMSRDPQFGPMLMFGLGGVFIETMKDVTFHLAPITRGEAIQMLKSTRSYAMLSGRHGDQSDNIDAIATGLQRISQLTTDFPQITELTISPFIIGSSGAPPLVGDGFIALEEPQQATRRLLS